MSKLGWIFFVAGVIVCGFAFVMNVGVDVSPTGAIAPSDSAKTVANLDLMAQRQLLMTCGIGIVLVGALLIVGNEICLAVRGAKPTPFIAAATGPYAPRIAIKTDDRVCLNCGKPAKGQDDHCLYCGKPLED